MTDTTDTTEYTNRCACGWEVTGPLDDVVDATIDHGLRIHNMEATRDQVVAVLTAPDATENTTDLSA
jgi:predicted small metal-binding protein